MMMCGRGEEEELLEEEENGGLLLYSSETEMENEKRERWMT